MSPGARREYTLFLTRKGLVLARDLGLTDDHSRYNPEKSQALLPHDLFITTFHLTIQRATEAAGSLHLVFWEQRRAALQDSVRVRYDRYSIKIDERFCFP